MVEISLKSGKNDGYFTGRRLYIYNYISRILLRIKKMFQAEVVQEIKKHTLCPVTLLRISCLFWDNVPKYDRTREVTDDKYGACALHARQQRLQTHT